MTEKIEKTDWPRRLPDGTPSRPKNGYGIIKMLAQLLKKRRGRAK